MKKSELDRIDDEFEYEITEQDLYNWRRETRGDAPIEGRKRESLVPYRTYTVRVENKENYKTAAKRRVFRFFGELDSVLTTKHDGSTFTQLVIRQPHWRNMVLQRITNGLAPLPSDVVVPEDIRDVPVDTWGPLAWAARPSPNTWWNHHEGKGMGQDTRVWAAVLMTDEYTDKEGRTKVFEIPAILSLKQGQALALAHEVRKIAENNPGWSMVGEAFRIYAEEQKVTTVVHVSRKERYHMAEIVPPDMKAQMKAIMKGVETLLVKNNAAIRGFPFEDSHLDDGWWDEEMPHSDRVKLRMGGQSTEGRLDSLSKRAHDLAEAGKTGSVDMSGLDEFKDIGETPPWDEEGSGPSGQLNTEDEWLELTNDQLRLLVETLGGRATRRTKREQLIAMVSKLQEGGDE